MLALFLEEYQRNRYATVEKFACQPRIASADPATMRQVAGRLSVSSVAIAQFTSPASATIIAMAPADGKQKWERLFPLLLAIGIPR
jgi:hypothetical protein